MTGGPDTVVYEQPSATPASYTIINFPVDDIEAAVDELAGRGVTFEQVPEPGTDERGIARHQDGPSVAWFKDPSGNVLSVLQRSTPVPGWAAQGISRCSSGGGLNGCSRSTSMNA